MVYFPTVRGRCTDWELLLDILKCLSVFLFLSNAVPWATNGIIPSSWQRLGMKKECVCVGGAGVCVSQAHIERTNQEGQEHN